MIFPWFEFANLPFLDGKRKASDEPPSPVASKRVKHDNSAEPEKRLAKIPAIPFPEKVNLSGSWFQGTK